VRGALVEDALSIWLRTLAPDVVVIKPCGFGVERTLEEHDAIERTILSEVGAGARVYVTDGNAFFNRPGPRIVDSAEILAGCTHPEVFDDFEFKHRGSLRRLR
jgi:iron complex transport system substrate-binding protein